MRDVEALGRDEIVATLVASTDSRGAALIGAPGAGSSTVLRATAAALERAGRRARLLRFPDPRDRATAFDADEVVVADDAHDASPSQALDLRDHALTHPVLIGVRAGAPAAHLRWLWRSGSVARYQLDPLDDEVIGQIVASRAGGELHRATLDAIVRRSAGRPAFALDEIQSLVADDRLTARAGLLRDRLAGTVASGLVERAGDVLADLPGTLRDAVETIAMAGQLPHDAMATFEIDLPSLEQRALVEIARDGDRAIVRLDPPGLTPAVMVSLPPARALEVARRLRSLALGDLAPDARARVLLLAGEPVGLDDLAAAARTALRDGRSIEAADLARRAAAYGPSGTAVEAEVLTELGGRSAAAERYAALMLDPAAPGELRARAAMEHSLISMWDLGRPAEAVATATFLAEAASDSPMGPAAAIHLASLQMYAGRPVDAARIAAGTDAASLGAAAPGRVLVDAISRALVDPTTVDVEPLRALIDRLDQGVFERGVVVAATELVLELTGEYDDAARAVRDARASGPVNETPASLAWLALAEARAELAIGRHEPSGRAALESAGLFADISHPSGVRWATAASLLAASMGGDRDAMQRAVTAFDRLDDGVPFLDPDVLRARAWAAHTLGDSSRAAALLREAVDIAESSSSVTLEAVALHDRYRLLGAPVRARLSELARRAPVPAIVLRARHLELAAANDAAGLLDLAADFERTGARLVAAEVAAEAARVATTNGARSLARTAAGQRARLASSCGDPVTPGLADHRPVKLTERERGVASLAAEGRTSRQIAQEFAISVRTVENLLQRAYVKLGVHGRAELANLLAARTGQGAAEAPPR